MQNILKPLLFIIVIVAITGGGLLAGKYVADSQRPLTQEEIALKEAKKEEKRQKKLQKQQEKEEARRLAKLKGKAKYQAAQPDFGPLIHLQNITVEYPSEQKDTAIGFLNKEDGSKIEIAQEAILYDKEDYVLPLGGEVSTKEDMGDKYKITISLPKGTNTKYLSNDLQIITFETIVSKRLPHSAVQTDKSGETFVWLIDKETENSTSKKITRLPITIGISDSEYFEEGTHKIEAHDYIVINPDKTLKKEKSYIVDFIDLEAPLHNPIYQAWVDYEIYQYNAYQEDADIRIAKCRGLKKVQTSDSSKNGETNIFDYNNPAIGDTSHTCSNTPPTTKPVDILNALLNKNITPIPSETGGGCGASASACGGSTGGGSACGGGGSSACGQQ